MKRNQPIYFEITLFLAISALSLSFAEDAPSAETVELVFPIVTAGEVDEPSTLQTEFVFMNLSNSTAQATLVG